MLYKRYKIKANVIILKRILVNGCVSACKLCNYGPRCTIISVCTEVFTSMSGNSNYIDYICVLYTKER